MKEMTLGELTALVGGRLDGDAGRVVCGMASLATASEREAAFLANPRYERLMPETHAAAVLVADDYAGPQAPETALIRCPDAYFAYRQAMVAFYGFREAGFQGVSPRAEVHPTATLGEGVRVAAGATVCAGVTLGEGTTLYPGAFVGENCRIGRHCRLYPNVVLYDGCILGDRVTVHANSSIGQDGFGYAPHKGDDGVTRHEKIPQAGWVELEDDVEIGAGCAIDRATMGATIIGAGTKLSNLVAIGHGTKMGRHCLMVAQAGIAGSTIVGNYCVFAGQAGVVGHIRIGDGVRVGAKSGVTHDVAAGKEVLGSPAIPLAQARRAMISMSRLPQMRTALQKMTRDLNGLRRILGRGGDKGGRDRREDPPEPAP